MPDQGLEALPENHWRISRVIYSFPESCISPEKFSNGFREVLPILDLAFPNNHDVPPGGLQFPLVTSIPLLRCSQLGEPVLLVRLGLPRNLAPLVLMPK